MPSRKHHNRSSKSSVITDPSGIMDLNYLSSVYQRDPRFTQRHIGAIPSVDSISKLGKRTYSNRLPVIPLNPTGEMPTNYFEYLHSLKQNSKLDRDFTNNGRRFVFLGLPTPLTPGMGMDALGDIKVIANQHNEGGEPLKALVNLYHGVCAFYLGLLNRSFDCLDLLKEISRYISEGGSPIATKIILDTTEKFWADWRNKDTIASGKQTEYIKNNIRHLNNLEWGETGSSALYPIQAEQARSEFIKSMNAFDPYKQYQQN